MPRYFMKCRISPDAYDTYVTVHMETHAVCKRHSPFENGLKSEPVYKRPRQYENREDTRLRQYESRKATCLGARVERE